MSNKCCTMWAESSRPENASSGDEIASQRVASPAVNATSLQTEKRPGKALCKINHPRQYRSNAAARLNEIFGSMDHELRIAWETDDIAVMAGHGQRWFGDPSLTLTSEASRASDWSAGCRDLRKATNAVVSAGLRFLP